MISSFVGSDVYYTYIVDNGFWDLRIRQRTSDEYFTSAGMLRLVMGLGTSAVDRTEGSYPRLVALNRPEATPSTTIAEKHQFSQKKIEAMDVKQHCLTRMELGKVEAHLPSYLKNILLEHDYEVESRIGTSSPELGVPTVFADISEFEVICELYHDLKQEKTILRCSPETDTSN